MEKIDKDKFQKQYVKTYYRVFSRINLEKERKDLVDRITEIEELLSEIKKVK